MCSSLRPTQKSRNTTAAAVVTTWHQLMEDEAHEAAAEAAVWPADEDRSRGRCTHLEAVPSAEAGIAGMLTIAALNEQFSQLWSSP